MTSRQAANPAVLVAREENLTDIHMIADLVRDHQRLNDEILRFTTRAEEIAPATRPSPIDTILAEVRESRLAQARRRLLNVEADLQRLDRHAQPHVNGKPAEDTQK